MSDSEELRTVPDVGDRVIVTEGLHAGQVGELMALEGMFHYRVKLGDGREVRVVRVSLADSG